MLNFFTGLATALITPFDENGVNFEQFGKMIEFQIAGGVDALVLLGTTGEPSTMTDGEKTAVMEYSVKKVAGRVKVIFGTGGNCTANAVNESVRAQNTGADGLLVVTPYYNKCTQKGIVEYYKSICGAVSIPVIAYNVPSRTGVNILPATAEELSYIPNLAGIKEACGNMAQICETTRRVRKRCDVFSGDDWLNIPILSIGGRGVISVASNLCPEKVKEVVTLTLGGRLAQANELQDRLLPLIDACFIEVNPIPVKYGCCAIGFNAGAPRAPLTELEDGHKKVMEKALEGAGIEHI